MISPKRLIKFAKRWQNLAASKWKRISLPRSNSGAVDVESCSTSSMAEKGHFVVYTADEQFFVIPLKCLKNNIIRGLLKIAEDEFGLPSDGPITLPCDAIFMEFVVSLIQRQKNEDFEEALLVSLNTNARCLPNSYLHQEQ